MAEGFQTKRKGQREKGEDELLSDDLDSTIEDQGRFEPKYDMGS